MSTVATPILHADVDAFFASVEQRDDPALRGREVIVGGGVVMAASYEARARGVRGGMGEVRARRLCPGAVWVAPRMDAYVAASREVLALFEAAAPQVEAVSVEEAFLDVSALASPARTPESIAIRLRRDARAQLGLPLTVGVARSKVLAKMASRAAKPDGLLVLEPERETAFLAPLAVERLWGVGPATADKLRARGLATVGAVAELPEHELAAVLGKAGARAIHAAVHGRDLRPVRPPGPRRSFGAQRALARGTATPERIDALLADVVERVTRRLQADGRAGRTVRLHLRFDDFTRLARARTLARATASPAAVEAAARALLDAAAPRIARDGLTCLGVSVDNLDAPGGGEQLALPLVLT
ncbi:DNA polymerase IV [Conexibacter woesei]|uniref:DNA polymerase IV n=1 Tax=Conexibacter woesei (strain DSM 14684 / CCUG 47730 / CIP 108061 / JCM 11494 / NBRC 100937 / ID131577) TaxID=469383 RepID=D3F745_CONWI|nr:DNA polymerase IV [Conexibacter woesei]ADB48816.1 DNA-directed DNA polymerase [Conexibacter woesei DSM 14684]